MTWLKGQAATRAANRTRPGGDLRALRRAWFLTALLGFAQLFTACVSRYPDRYQPIAAGTIGLENRLASRLATQIATNGGKSGFYVLDSNLEAFQARAELIDAAQHKLDVQSYIMRGDVTGRLLGERILRAADRGVCVRLLVDDVSVLWKDSSIGQLDGHPNIELRVFNPFIGIRTSRWLVLYDFIHAGRLTRRMHNKLFAADDALAIVGGRNIGDDYFAEREGISFMDLDVLVTGPVVGKLSTTFDEYWESEWAYPLAAFRSERESTREYQKIRRDVATKTPDEKTAAYLAALRESDLLARLLSGRLPLEWAHARVVYDRPDKIDGDLEKGAIQVSPEVWALAESVREELIVLSPYFVPGDEGVALFRKLRQRGVRVRILTNSMKSTDVLLAFTGYARYRRALLDAGVELFELKPTAVSGRRDRLRRRGTQSSLHTKSFIFDRRTVFVGSMNLDQRAHFLNTELGLIIESPELANTIAGLFEESTQQRNSYHVHLGTRTVLTSPKYGGSATRRQTLWLTEEKGRQVRFAVEPHAGLCLQLWCGFLRLLPLEGQL